MPWIKHWIGLGMEMKNLSQIRTKTHHSNIPILRWYYLHNYVVLLRKKLKRLNLLLNLKLSMNWYSFCLTKMKNLSSIHSFIIDPFNSFIHSFILFEWVNHQHLCGANKVEFSWISSLIIYITVFYQQLKDCIIYHPGLSIAHRT